MNNEPKPGTGFFPTVSSKPRAEVVPNPAPAPVVHNFNVFVDPQAAAALRGALMSAAIYALAVIVLLVLIRCTLLLKS